jgi:glycosyltransferase involved in cell wall biosynthesis
MLVSYGGADRGGLPRFFVTAFWKTLTSVLRRRIDVVVIGDVFTFVVLWPLLAVLRVPTATMAMGLDLTRGRWYYRSILRFVLPRATRVLSISHATQEVVLSYGVSPERCAVIPIGSTVTVHAEPDRAAMSRALRTRLRLGDDAVVLVTLGTLVRRKGARWFIEHVMPKLPSQVHYAVAGSGPDHDAIEHAIAATATDDRVHLLGRVDDAEREELLSGADMFVQPNVRVTGDMEGFGLVVVEAACRATPVVASDLEGLRDAIVDGSTGILLPSGDDAAWANAITDLVADRAHLRELGWRFRTRALELSDEAPIADVLIAELSRTRAGRP